MKKIFYTGILLALLLIIAPLSFTAEDKILDSLEAEFTKIIQNLEDWAEKERGSPWDMDDAMNISEKYNIEEIEFKDGIMNFTSKKDPYFFLSLGGKTIDGSYCVFAVRMFASKSGSGQVYYWSTDGDYQGFVFSAREGWHTYLMDINSSKLYGPGGGLSGPGGGSEQRKKWGGQSTIINKFRFDPVDEAGIQIKVDWIKLLKGDETTRKKIADLMPDLHFEYFGNITRKSFPPVSLKFLRQPIFTFAIITDTHIGKEGDEHHYCHPKRVLEAIKQINEFKPAFVIHCGDMITTFPARPEYEEQLDNAMKTFRENLKVPIYFAPGNHDVGDKVSFGDPKAHAKVTDEFIDAYRKRFGNDYLSLDYKDCHFILLNNAIFNSGTEAERKQWEWLEKDLEKAKNSRFIFIFFHNVLFWSGLDDEGPQNYETIDEPARSKLIALAKKYKVKAFFQGHTHWSFSNYLDNIEFQTLYSTTFARALVTKKYSGSATGPGIFDPYKCGYYFIRVYPEDVIMQFVQSYPKIPEFGEFQKDNRTLRSRILTRNASEIKENLFGAIAGIPKIERRVEGKFIRNVVVDQPVTLPGQVGIKWLKVQKSFTAGETYPEGIDKNLKRLLTTGKPKGVNLVVPLVVVNLEGDWSIFSEFKDKINGWEILNRDINGETIPSDRYFLIFPKSSEKLRKFNPEAKIIAGEIPISDEALIDGYISAGILKNADAVLFDLDLSLISETEYKERVKKLKQKMSLANPRIEIWLNLENCPQDKSDLALAKYLARLIVMNQDSGVRTFINSSGKNFSILDEDMDPTNLYYVLMTMSALFDKDAFIIGKPEIIFSRSLENLEKRMYRDINGNLFLAVWISGKIEDKFEGIPVDITLQMKVTEKPVIIDPLTATFQELNYRSSGENTIIPGVILQDYPIFIKL